MIGSEPQVVESQRTSVAPANALRRLPSIYLFLLPLGTAGAFFMGWLMPFGAGIYVDSLYYVSSARNLVAGIGMGRVTGLGTFKPMTHYPPLYSLVLAFFDLLGLTELTTARWISLLAFGFTIILVGLIVYQRTNSRFFSLFSALLVLLSNPILRSFSWVMSEPLYIVLMLSSLLFLGIYIQDSRLGWLLLAATFTSLSLLTRYVGFSLAVALALVLFLNRHLRWTRRLRDLAVFLSISILPTLAWLVRTWLISGTLANRMVNWHPISAENGSFLVKAVNSWGFLPQRLLVGQGTVVFVAIIIILLLASLFWLLRTLPRQDIPPKLEVAVLIAGWSYIILLIASLFYLDATTRLENRILLPLYVMLLLLIIIGLALLWRCKAILVRLSVALVCLWLAYFSVTRVDGAIADLRADGQGYASLQWQNSPTIRYIRQQDASLIYTNDVTAIYFLAEKDSVAIPNANSTEAHLNQMRSNLGAHGSYLVIFGPVTGEFTPLDQLTRDLSLVSSFEDGNIYQQR